MNGLEPGITYVFVVEARNLVGFSLRSDTVTELAAQIPDKPVLLANVPGITLADRIGLTWAAPEFNGGSPIIDYRIWFDNATGSVFEVLAEGLSLSYTALALTKGETYTLKVESRNLYGYSAFSDSVSILAAQTPDTPVAPVAIWSPDDVIIDWTAPDYGGSPITSYTIYIR